jgi:hypothetical protein
MTKTSSRLEESLVQNPGRQSLQVEYAGGSGLRWNLCPKCGKLRTVFGINIEEFTRSFIYELSEIHADSMKFEYK